MDFFCGFMVVELGVAVVVVVEGGGIFIMGHMWVHGGEGGGVAVVRGLPWVSGLRFLGLSWGGGVAMGFGLGMFFVVVVVAAAVVEVIWVLGYIILLRRNIILMCCIVK